jgi:hypothetical protein
MLEKPFKSRIFRGELIKVIVRNYVFFFFFLRMSCWTWTISIYALDKDAAARNIECVQIKGLDLDFFMCLQC